MAPLLGTGYEPSLICMESLVIVHDGLNCLAYETYHRYITARMLALNILLAVKIEEENLSFSSKTATVLFNSSDSITAESSTELKEFMIMATRESEDPVRMLVLETDSPHPDIRDEKGGYSDILNALFQDAGKEHDPPLKIETEVHYVVDDPENGHHGHVPQVSDVDPSMNAILITGSMYDAHGDDPWIQQLLQFLRGLWIERKDMKFSGVCFGHQILSRALGAKVEPEPSGRWELSHTDMDLTSVGQKLFQTKDKKLSLHQMHQDQVTIVPSASTTDLLSEDDNVENWASTEHTKIQGLYLRERLFTSQGHLGFDEDMVHLEIEMRVESGGIKDKDVAEKAKDTAHLRHDGLVVAGAILRFFHGDDRDIS